MKNRIGIMNGRLSKPVKNMIQAFPESSWKDEFEKARKIGFEFIDWVFDLNKNPIMVDDGIEEILFLAKKNDVSIDVVCADYFMYKRLFNVSEYELQKNLEILQNLIRQCNKLKIKIIELPFVDLSSLQTTNDKKQIINNLEKILPLIEDNDIILALETDLPPSSFMDLLLAFNHPKVLANYDVGNSTSNGYDPKEELTILKDFIAIVHVKDRILNGGTVPLGIGDTDFDSFFSTLNKIAYKGDLVIQGAREDLINSNIGPEETCKKYYEFVKKHLNSYLC